MATPQCSGCRFFVVLEGQQVLDVGLIVPTEPHWGECRAQPPLAAYRDASGACRLRLAATWPLSISTTGAVRGKRNPALVTKTCRRCASLFWP